MRMLTAMHRLMAQDRLECRGRMSLMACVGRCCGLSEVKQGDIWQVSWRGIGRSGLSGAALGWQGNCRWREMTEPVGRLVIRAVASLGDAGI